MVALLTHGLPLIAIAAALLGSVLVGAIALVAHTDPAGVFRWLLLPTGALARALLPFALVVLVIAVFATAQLGPFAQVISGLALAVLVWLFFRKQGPLRFERHQVAEGFLSLLSRTPLRAEPAPLQPTGHSARLPWVALVIGLAVVVPFLHAPVPDAPGLLDPATAARGAILLFLIAIPFRLVGYTTTRIRIAIAILVALLLWRELTWTGVLRGESHLDGLSPKWTGVLVLTSILGLLILEGGRYWPSPKPTDGHRITRAIGFILAALAAGILGVALLFASSAVNKAPAPKLANAADPTDTPTTVRIATSNHDLNLAWTYVPVLHLRHDEKYPPISVDDFLAGATSRGADGDGSGRPVDITTLPKACADPSQERCAQLDCPDCIKAQLDPDTAPHGYVPQGEVYARVIHRNHEPRAFAGWNPWGKALNVLIQYWIFYGYDSWQATTPIGVLTQQHQGDWEHVTVGLTTNTPVTDAQQTIPRFVALSAHCGGQVVDWGNVDAAFAPAPPIDRTTHRPRPMIDPISHEPRLQFNNRAPDATDEVSHPIVAVARGSHANYALSTDNRPPDWGSCNNLPTQLIESFSFATNIRDVTDTDNTGWYAYPRGITLVDAQTPPMSYPGTWSPKETVTFGYGDDNRIGAGPPSPPLQGQIWTTPIRSYFCGPRWRERGKHIPDHPELHGTNKQC